MESEEHPETNQIPEEDVASDTEPQGGGNGMDDSDQEAAAHDDSDQDAADHGDSDQEDTGEAGQDTPFSIDCDTLPIDLRFELARQSSTLKELSQLKVGTVVGLDKTPETVIDIYANGRRVGVAELVIVDGKVGVRIKSRQT